MTPAVTITYFTVLIGVHYIAIKLNCSVLGNNIGRVFEVKIAPTGSVSTLKELIKEKKRPLFDHVPVDHLDLWKVSDLTPTVGFW